MAISLPELIPFVIFAIPLTAVVGKHIIRPVLETLTHLMEQRQPIAPSPEVEKRMELLEDRLGDIEDSLKRVLEEQEFRRLLESAPPKPPAPAQRVSTEVADPREGRPK